MGFKKILIPHYIKLTPCSTEEIMWFFKPTTGLPNKNQSSSEYAELIFQPSFYGKAKTNSLMLPTRKFKKK